MHILFLGKSDSKLIPVLEEQGNKVLCSMERVAPDFITQNQIDFLVSYRYRYILKDNVLELLPHRSVNLHISLLPWNKGADPNLWSFLENTPKGVSLHLMDAGIDTGHIIEQKSVDLSDEETLRSSYQKLSEEIENLFIETWPKIQNGSCRFTVQNQVGTYHKKSDKEKYLHLLDKGWDTPVKKLIGAALNNRI